MTQIKTVKAGKMPGRIEEFAVATGSSIKSLLEIAGLDASGHEVKVDGVVVTNLDSTLITDSTNVVILAKQVKGNGTVKVGAMPGRIEEYALEDNATIADAIALAGLSTSGFEVKVDGSVVTDFSRSISGANTILLTKQVKGNATVKVGAMPGRIEEYALEDNATVADAIALAGLNTSGYEVKVDGSVVTDFSRSIGGANTILLTKQVKGNN